jgi:hypothetical protein
MPNGQQIHISHPKSVLPNSVTDTLPDSGRHPCFKINTAEDLLALQKKIWTHHREGKESSCVMADEPGEKNSG